MDTDTGDITEGDVPRRSVPDARVHPVSGRREVDGPGTEPSSKRSKKRDRTERDADKPRKEAVYGTYFWHSAVRGNRPHERVIFQVDRVAAQKGKANSESHVAERNLIKLGQHVPGIQAFVTDNLFGGNNIDRIQRATGKVVITPVTAERILADGTRIEKETKLREVEFTDGARTETVEAWSVGGRAHQRVYDVQGDSTFEPLARRRSFFNEDKHQYRAYVEIEIPNPLGGNPKIIRERAYNRPPKPNTKDDNRVENFRTIPPGDTDYINLYPLKSDAESLNRGIDDSLPLRRARSYTAQRQQLDLIGFARAQNSLARYLYGTTRAQLDGVA